MISRFNHDQLAELALVWLANKATSKGIAGATEVSVTHGYVADAAALVSFQYQYFENYFKYSGLKPLIGHAIKTGTGTQWQLEGDVEDYFGIKSLETPKR